MRGNPGGGTTHSAIGVARAACRQGFRVRFSPAAGLLNALIQAQDDHRRPRVLATALTHHLLVIDALGCIPFSPTGAHLIVQCCSSLYERVAMIVTPHVRVADGTQVFGDERLTAAVLDRLTYRAPILACVGESCRVRQRLQRDAQQHTGA
jgi:DNA replication protein DnaC